MSKRNALAFAAGFGGAYIKGKERQQELDREMERQRVEDSWRDEQRGAWRAEQADKKAMRASLADAIRPTAVDSGYQVSSEAGSSAFTKDADAAAMMTDMVADQRPSLGQAYRAAGKTFADRAGAETAANDYNSQPATLERMGAAVAPIDPAKAISLQSAASTARNAQQKAEEDRRARAKAMEAEGVGQTYKAMLSRSPEAVFQAFNATGNLKLKEPPRIVETRVVKTPYGEIEDDVWEGVAVGPDGKETPIRRSTQQVGMQVFDVKDLLKSQMEGQKMAAEQRNRLELEDVKAGNARGLEGLRQQRPVASRSGGDGSAGENRKLYTTLLTEVGRKQSEAQKAYNTLIKEPAYAYARPGSPQAQALEAMQESIKAYAAKAQEYESLLAQGASQGAAAPGLSSARGPTGGRGQSDRDAERMTILRAELEKARAAGNTADVQALEREIARASGQQKPPSLSAVQPRPAAGQIPRITTKAERDALPPGARYVGPSGNIAIKK